MKTDCISSIQRRRATEPANSNSGLYEVSRQANKVMIVGGMDTLPPARILGSLLLGYDGAGLPEHRAIVVTLHRGAGDAAGLPYELGLSADIPQRTSHPSLRARCPTSRLDAWVSDLAPRVLRCADANARFDARGRGANWIGRLMAGSIRLPLSYLYDPGHAALEYARLVEILKDPQLTTIVGASFGGSVALDTLIRAIHQGHLKARPMTLITLGTNFGEILTRSPLYRGLPRTSDGRIACPPQLRWLHFFSPSDVFVGASARPRNFAGVQEVSVDTGPLLTWPPNKAHGMARYLRTPEVQSALRQALEVGRHK
jgi:hypothetical protein